MASKKINVGFIGLSGTGWAANTLAPAVAQPSLKEIYDIAAVSTTSETSAQASAEKYSKVVGHPIKAYFGNTSQIASDPEVDFVFVSVKAPHHKEAVLPVIEAKKDFFIEWPAGASIEETEEIAAAARKQGVRSIVGLQGRHSFVSLKVKELLSSGVIGAVKSTNVFAHLPREQLFWAPYTTEKGIYTIHKKNGATPLIIPIGHQLDTLTNVLGDFNEVTATAATLYPVVTVVDQDGKPTGKTYPSEIHDHFSIAGTLQTGVLANIFWRLGYASSEGRRQYIWEIEGEEGVIRVESNHVSGALPGLFEPDLYLNGKKIDIGEHGGPIESVGVMLKEFAEGGSRLGSYATIEHALKHKKLLSAIETSAKEGKRVTLTL